jgi:hypothetical protein
VDYGPLENIQEFNKLFMILFWVWFMKIALITSVGQLLGTRIDPAVIRVVLKIHNQSFKKITDLVLVYHLGSHFYFIFKNEITSNKTAS